MGNRNPARLLAPLALVAAFAAVIVVVQAAGTGSSDSTQTATVTRTQDRPARRRARKRVYVVKAGDNLSLIAERTGVSLETIEQLNPDLDAQALRVGQRLRLAP
ncbi:LysM peptidoglycan-binding domain-containing protein [Conexibacter arvalis]|uniref:LysM repeat protein n=1 Tax=Conexibacter arvalis TaxID=912552 RepID=A0A840IE10_9ACTN|nr:LysM domain-containing protein [Conexibacter arvalis]MBB4662481.1 LysM repeat protein [Conexibacter arvalis]